MQEIYDKANPDEPPPMLKLRDLRHTGATLALQEGTDIHISERLGHSCAHIIGEIDTHVSSTRHRVREVAPSVRVGYPA